MLKKSAAPFSHLSEAQRTAQVRFASTLAHMLSMRVNPQLVPRLSLHFAIKLCQDNSVMKRIKISQYGRRLIEVDLVHKSRVALVRVCAPPESIVGTQREDGFG
jgi:hypothetical protein